MSPSLFLFPTIFSLAHYEHGDGHSISHVQTILIHKSEKEYINES